MNQKANRKIDRIVDKKFYMLGGIAAWIVVLLMLGEILFFVFYPAPETVIGWFNLFQNNALIGILDFWGLEIPMYLMFILVFLTLFYLLREKQPYLMAIALTFVIVGSAIFLSTNNPFSMLILSNQHAAAATAVEKSTLVGAGDMILANTNQRAVGGFNVGLFLVSIAGLLTSSVSLNSQFFRKATAITGILAFGLSLLDYLRQVLTQSLLISLLIILSGALCLSVWFFLVGRKLYQLGSAQKPSNKQKIEVDDL